MRGIKFLKDYENIGPVNKNTPGDIQKDLNYFFPQ
jgi:hypothetical protein